MDRRRLFLTGGALLVPPVEALVTPGRGRWFDDARTVVDYMHANYGERDVATTARAAGTHLRALASMATTRMPARATGELLGTQARVGALRARALADLGSTQTARETLDTATARATRAKDWATLAYCWALRATLETRADMPAAGLAAVAAGLSFVDTDPRLFAAGARAHAARGELDDARRALGIARELLDDQDAAVVAPAAPGAMGRLEFARVAVDVTTRIGHVAEAQRTAEEVVKAVPNELRADTELALASTVAPGLAPFDVERGAATLKRVLLTSAAMGRPARPVVERVERFCRSVVDPMNPAVTDLVDLRETLDV